MIQRHKTNRRPFPVTFINSTLQHAMTLSPDTSVRQAAAVIIRDLAWTTQSGITMLSEYHDHDLYNIILYFVMSLRSTGIRESTISSQKHQRRG